MQKKFAVLFPGQGSQHLGLLFDLSKQYSIVEDTFSEASNLLGYDLWRLVQEGPQDQLDQTEFTQPALLAADVACFRCWRASGGPMPDFMAGHSLGEYAALVCAESLSYTEAILLVAKRGRYMQEAVPSGEGAMGAIVGLEPDAIEHLCTQIAMEKKASVSPANFNSIGQTVIAGHSHAVDAVLVAARAAGAKLAKRIPVSVPAHCSLMQPAADRLQEDLSSVHFKPGAVPVVHNTDAAVHNPATLPKILMQQLISPVRWVETIQFLVKQDIFLFLESGPDNKLAGLNKRISDKVVTLPLKTSQDIQAAMARIEIKECNIVPPKD